MKTLTCLAVSFLREDLLDLRTEVRQEIRDLRADFQALRNEVRRETRDVRIELGTLRDDFAALNRRVDELTAHMERRFAPMQMTQIATNIAMAGAIIAAIKL